MPYTKIKSGPDKDKYRSPSGEVVTREQIAAIHLEKQRAAAAKGKGGKG